jgi:hypothetical protein
MNMEYMLFASHHDRPTIQEFIDSLMPLELGELIEKYNSQVSIGVVGVRKQALYLFALGFVFKKKTGQSPVRYDSSVLSLTGRIEQDGEGFRYELSKN